MSAVAQTAHTYHSMLKHSRFASLAAKLRVERYVWAACATATSTYQQIYRLSKQSSEGELKYK